MDIIETLIIIGIAVTIGFVNDKTKPTEYYYENRIVTVEGYCYAPLLKKRDHLREMEAVVYSLQFPN